MTGNTQDYIEYITAQFAPLTATVGAITTKRFFGGQGLCCESTQFAMLMGNALFLVVDDSNRAKYVEMGTECFWYMKQNKKIQVRKYHEVPAEIMEDQDTLLQWARESLAIARTLSSKKVGSKKRK